MGPKDMECEGVQWICLVQVTDKWRAAVKMVITVEFY